MADKFTPYALTALPAAQNRDVNGIYFIRVPDGMEIYAIADTPSKTAVPLKVVGYVDLQSEQYIDGRKVFGRVDYRYLDFLIIPPPDEGVIYLQKDYDGALGYNFSVSDNGDVKTLFLKLDELDIRQTDLTVRKLNTSEEVSKHSGKIVGRADNYLGFKKEFEFAQALTLPKATFTIPFVNDYIPAWDDGQALIQSLQWDIVWDNGAGGSIFQSQSLKYSHFSKMNIPIEIRRTTAFGWHFFGNLNTELTIPQHAKLVIW